MQYKKKCFNEENMKEKREVISKAYMQISYEFPSIPASVKASRYPWTNRMLGAL